MDLAQAQAQLDLWLAASQALATSHSYTIGTQTFTRADGSTVLRMIDYWEKKVSRLSSSTPGIKVFGVTPS
jgi:hypothetical protein